MKIVYKITKDIEPAELESLFLSLDWSSGRYPALLHRALLNYGCVVTAWDGNLLVGLIGAIDDGVMTAYVHYFLVRPDYQKQGIGHGLIMRLKEYYKDFLRILLVAYPDAIPFYERHGFCRVKDEALRNEVPLYLTQMED